jgi:hypothetical protein
VDPVSLYFPAVDPVDFVVGVDLDDSVVLELGLVLVKLPFITPESVLIMTSMYSSIES